MRKYLKNRCLSTLSLLQEAHEELVRLTEQGKSEEALALLQQCQEGAIGVGNLIEDAEGEGTEEVRALERYCELLWECSNEINEGTFNPKKLLKRLGKPLLQAANGIEARIPTQREVVFLPYKASMWDSLEPVWEKLKEDPLVTTYVIPIPYADRNPDGSVREVHYEGAMFPEKVPITDYEHYSLEERHPDAIYIHNPYDGANYVTSVDPEYYSSRLKELTEELVYIPYFVLGEIDPDNEQALEANENFILVPAVFNAHRVIVQSEAWRKAYIEVLTKQSGEETRDYWEKKIEGSGSPKLERVRNLKPEDYVLPPEWERVVMREDGSRRKIIFYNNGLSALLSQNEKMIDKISRVLEIFHENAADVTLLWRPHPLIEATLTSMRPDLREAYHKLVQEYRESGWGIYDDSAELDRAIAVSDAYYGDMSSVVWLYKETGKPIMIQNCEV